MKLIRKFNMFESLFDEISEHIYPTSMRKFVKYELKDIETGYDYIYYTLSEHENNSITAVLLTEQTMPVLNVFKNIANRYEPASGMFWHEIITDLPNLYEDVSILESTDDGKYLIVDKYKSNPKTLQIIEEL